MLVYSEQCKHTSHSLWGSCELASKVKHVTGDELDTDVSIALFRNQSILGWCRVICVAILPMPPY